MIAADLAYQHANSGMTLRTWSEQEYQDLLDDPKTIIVHTNAGYAIGTIVCDVAELLLIITRPALRRNGHGKNLLSQFESTAKARGGDFVILEVSEKNLAAQALYLSTGYTEIGRRSGYYKTQNGDSEDALVLRKAL